MISKYSLAIILIFITYSNPICQIQPYFKTGINIGFINQEYWMGSNSSGIIKYGKPLLRPIVTVGLGHTFQRITFKVGIMYQTKGQGTQVPRVRNSFQSISSDVIHFMSFPIGLEYKLIKNLDVICAIQPSLFLGGVDNYYASEYWRGWVWNGVIGIQYTIKENIDIGFEYDHDFKLYYCEGCDVRFLTYRLFTSIPIGKSKDY